MTAVCRSSKMHWPCGRCRAHGFSALNRLVLSRKLLVLRLLRRIGRLAKWGASVCFGLVLIGTLSMPSCAQRVQYVRSQQQAQQQAFAERHSGRLTAAELRRQHLEEQQLRRLRAHSDRVDSARQSTQQRAWQMSRNAATRREEARRRREQLQDQRSSGLGQHHQVATAMTFCPSRPNALTHVSVMVACFQYSEFPSASTPGQTAGNGSETRQRGAK